MTFGEICTLIITIVGVLPTIVSLVALLINMIKTKNWDLMKQIADDAMKTVEAYSKEHPDMSSDDKKNMAIEAIKAGLDSAKIKYNEKSLKQIASYIQDSISWLNNMNK